MVAAAMRSDPWNEISEILLDGRSVVVEGGAGSGKTYALVKTISQLHEERPNLSIACITYTNAAAQEVMARSDSANLRVSTIHDFLWDCISPFQRELAVVLAKAVSDENRKRFKPPLDEEGIELKLNFESVSYKDYVRIADGVVSHDHILELAQMMFNEYEKLRRITADRYPCILVDEYQDTSPMTIDVLANLIDAEAPHNCAVAFFGDSMQSIYDGAIGSLDGLALQKSLAHVQIEQNRRNPERVISLANKLRVDGLKQMASDDDNAPNMQNGKLRQGEVFLVEGDNPHGEEIIKESGILGNQPGEPVKILRLTHRLIANDGGFPTIQSLYDGSDCIIALAKAIKKKAEKDNRTDLDMISFGELAKLYPCPQRGKGLSRLEEILQDELWKREFDKASGFTLGQLSSHYLKPDNLYANGDSYGFAPDWCPVTVMARKLVRVIRLYEDGDYAGLFRITGRVAVRSIKDKEVFARRIEEIAMLGDSLVGEAIDFAVSENVLEIDDSYNRFKEEHRYLFDRMRAVNIKEFRAFFEYYDDLSPYMTQHKVKGLEYDYVIVTLDNGKWNNYNYGRKLVSRQNDVEESDVVKRTRRLLYVACTRAKKGLALYTCGVSLDREMVEYLFDSSQVVSLDEVRQNHRVRSKATSGECE